MNLVLGITCIAGGVLLGMAPGALLIIAGILFLVRYLKRGTLPPEPYLAESAALAPEPAPAIQIAAEALAAGGVVAFPTETVYGLGVAWDNAGARAALSALKGQPADKPFQMLLADAKQLAQFSPAADNPEVRRLACLWPGPLTLVLPAHGGGTVGVRVPDHPVIGALLATFGRPIAATSANRHGEPECPDAEAVRAQFAEADILILEGDAGAEQRASTVAKYEDGTLTILREGPIPEALLRTCLNRKG